MNAHALRKAYIDLFLLASRLRSGAVGSAQASEVRDWALKQLKQARAQILGAGFDDEILNDAHLAVAGLLDEAAKGVGGDFAKQWDPQLQFVLFEHNDAGNKVFDRLDKLVDDPRQPVELLEIYARCLAFGFEGRYKPDKPDKLKSLREDLYKEVQRRLGAPCPWNQEPDHITSAPLAPKILGPLTVAGSALFLLLVIGAGLFVSLKWEGQKVAKKISVIGTARQSDTATGRREQGE